MTALERFLKYIDKTDTCWNWCGGRSEHGYGNFNLKAGTVVKAHRASFEFFIGPITEGLSVLHRCDNPSCVNPEHLFLGTQKENKRDCARKGRNGKKLVREDVLAIREDKSTTAVIAKKFNITAGTVRKIRSGTLWQFT